MISGEVKKKQIQANLVKQGGYLSDGAVLHSLKFNHK